MDSKMWLEKLYGHGLAVTHDSKSKVNNNIIITSNKLASAARGWPREPIQAPWPWNHTT